VVETDHYFLRAIDEDPSDPRTITCYANFLCHCSRLERAEDFFLRALEADSFHFESLKSYHEFLVNNKEDLEAAAEVATFLPASEKEEKEVERKVQSATTPRISTTGMQR
jgi:Tetratricopeptide repeat